MNNVTSYCREGKKGQSIWLDYRVNGIRKQERTGLVFLAGKDSKTKQLNKETQILLDHMILEKQIAVRDGIIVPTEIKRQRTDFFKYFEEHMELHPSKERRNKSTLKKLKEFYGKPVLPLTEVTEKLLKKFKIFLEAKHKGETAYDYFKALKTVLKQATKESLFSRNPADDVIVPRKSGVPKNALTINELTELYTAECPNEIVKKAFIFSCYTGLRYGDIKNLCWQDINENFVLKITQAKTKHPVNIALGEVAKEMIGERKLTTDFIFPLPTGNGTNKNIKVWLKNTGVDKKITYHCARHTFATLLHSNGVDILTTSLAMGHKSMKETPRYVRVADLTINNAVLNIPRL